MHGEKESLSGQRLSKDHSWRITENSWVSGSENLLKTVKQPLHHHMLFGRISRTIILAHPKTISSIFSYQTLTGTSNGTGFFGQITQKNSFFSANTQDRFGEHMDKKYPMCTMKYTAIILMLWTYISAGGLDMLFRHIASWILSNTTDKKINKLLTVRNLIMGHVWIFQP